MDTPTSPEKGQSGLSRLPTRTKYILVGVAVLIAVALVLYFIGLSQGQRRVAEVEQQLQQVQQQLDQTRAQRARVEGRSRMVEALALLYRTALDLDDRNFGTANERLQAATGALSGVASTDVDTEALEQLREEIAATNVNVAVNLKAQRARVVTFAERLKALIPEAPDAETAPVGEEN